MHTDIDRYLNGEKVMKYPLIAAVSGVALLGTLPASAQAKDWRLVPNIGFQYRNLSFDETLTFPNGEKQKGDLDVNLPMASLGLTFIYSRFYAALKYEDSFETYTDSDVPGTEFAETGDKVDTAVTRTDWSFTVGGTVWRTLNVFAGYLNGETELSPTPAFRDCLNCTDNYDANFAWFMDNTARRTYRQTYREDGWYLGLSYGWSIAQKGTLALSGAYAFMDGRYEDNYFPEDNLDFDYEGDSQGYSLALTWSAPLTEHLGYYFDLRRQAYDFDGKDKSGNYSGYKVKTTEVMNNITAGVRWFI